MLLLGYDIGSSSIKATLLDAEKGISIYSTTSPKTEMEILAPRSGWAEQNPETWWNELKNATAEILNKTGVDPSDIKAIGISYQMHGLVIVDKNKNVLRPSIIWCDSRAVEIGETAFDTIGNENCLKHFLNSPGNFTASKLKWVKENEPDIFRKISKAMLPGDYIAMKMTDDIRTTPSGLSEGILWDYLKESIADTVLDYYGIPASMIADAVPTFSVQGELTTSAATELGLAKGTLVSYRAGDQPNNALSLNVLNPGEIATTAGTSGVVYGVTDKINYDLQSRVNPFIHVNHKKEKPRLGILMCINGTGIMNSWMKNIIGKSHFSYSDMNKMASGIAAGSNGLKIIPYGNGAERTLGNKDIGASIYGINLNIHDERHLFRAVQEGIAFAFNYGLGIMKDMGLELKKVRAGDTNMFLSPVFREIFATISGAVIELYNTDGSQGAARGAGIGSGIYKNTEDAFKGLEKTMVVEPNSKLTGTYAEIYNNWLSILNK